MQAYTWLVTLDSRKQDYINSRQGAAFFATGPAAIATGAV